LLAMASSPGTTSSSVSSPAMRKLVRSGYGSPEDVLSLVTDAGVPSIEGHAKAKEVGLVKVKVVATALSPADYRFVEGWVRLVIQERFPAGLGLEFSGVVTESSSAKYDIGDEVFGENHSVVPSVNVGVQRKFVVLKLPFPSLRSERLS